mgnify:CR=1 FL=1
MKLPESKPTNEIWIGTHNGTFHMDELFAIAILYLYCTRLGKKVRIFRTRDKEILAQMDYLVDVGGKYDEKNFDHHQLEGAERRPNGTPLASVGLVWKKFGPLLCPYDTMYRIIEKKMIEPIDLWDNGDFRKTIADGSMKGLKNGKQYKLPNLYFIVESWRKSADTPEVMDQHFEFLVTFFSQTLEHEIKHLIKQEVERRGKKSSLIIVIREHDKVAEAIQLNPHAWCVIYPRNKRQSSWLVRIIKKPTQVSLFPQSWSRMSQSELAILIGTDDIISFQKGGYYASARSHQGAIRIAEFMLNNPALIKRIAA